MMGAVTKNLLARCVDATGSPTAAILLYRICYWHPHAKVQRHGVRWIAKDRTTWMEETSLTPKQYRGAVETLRGKLLIQVEQHVFGRKNVSFVRLTDRGTAVREGGWGDAPEGTLECALEGAPEQALEGALLDHKGDTAKEVHEPPHYVSGGGADWNDPQNSAVVEGTHLGYKSQVKEDVAVATVKEMLLSGSKKPVSLSQVNAAPGLQQLWRESVAKEYGGYVPSLTQKQLGQLRLFGKACPAGKAGPVLAEVVRDWPGFATQVKVAAGLQVVPSQPSVDFLLKHVGQAVTFGLDALEPKKVAAEAPPKPQVPVQLTAHAPKHAKASKEEALAILNDDEE